MAPKKNTCPYCKELEECCGRRCSRRDFFPYSKEGHQRVECLNSYINGDVSPSWQDFLGSPHFGDPDYAPEGDWTIGKGSVLCVRETQHYVFLFI